MDKLLAYNPEPFAELDEWEMADEMDSEFGEAEWQDEMRRRPRMPLRRPIPRSGGVRKPQVRRTHLQTPRPSVKPLRRQQVAPQSRINITLPTLPLWGMPPAEITPRQDVLTPAAPASGGGTHATEDARSRFPALPLSPTETAEAFQNTGFDPLRCVQDCLSRSSHNQSSHTPKQGEDEKPALPEPVTADDATPEESEWGHPQECSCKACHHRKQAIYFEQNSIKRNRRSNGTINSETEVVEAVALGVAAFEAIRGNITSGDLSVGSDMAHYVHASTPANVGFKKKSLVFKISAHHPRYGFDRQNFFFVLSFEYNGYDIKSAFISVLRDKSSSLYSSTFNVYFSAVAYSPATAPRTSITFNIMNGRWDPVGRGDVAFYANPLVTINADGGLVFNKIQSDKGWVTFDGYLKNSLRDEVLHNKYNNPTQIQEKPTTTKPKYNSKNTDVVDLQIRLNRWLTSQARQTLDVDGVSGRKTRRAVMEFQRANNLKVDGVAGSQTWSVLRKYW